MAVRSKAAWPLSPVSTKEMIEQLVPQNALAPKYLIEELHIDPNQQQEYLEAPSTPATLEYSSSLRGYPSSPTRSVHVASPKRMQITSTNANTASSTEYTTKVLGSRLSTMTELNPSTPSQMIRLKHRASTLIQRYAGSNWREAQRSKWLLDLVSHIDKDYREYILDQATHINHLQEQMSIQQQSHSVREQEAQAKIMDLGDDIIKLRSQLRDAEQVALDLQMKLANAEIALGSADQAASVAAHECAELQKAVKLLASSEASTRKSMAQRNFLLKEGLRQSESKARELSESERRHRMEVQAVCKVHDDEIVKQRRNLEKQHSSQIRAVQAAEQASAQISVERVKLEMEAYKEPWRYLHGNKSPTANAEIAGRLGLRMTSLNTLFVPP